MGVPVPFEPSGKVDIERVVDDFVLFCMLIGNDFLPGKSQQAPCIIAVVSHLRPVYSAVIKNQCFSDGEVLSPAIRL